MDFNLYIFPASLTQQLQLPATPAPFDGDLASSMETLFALYQEQILVWDPMLRLYRQPEKLLHWSTEVAPLVNIFYMPASGMAEYAFFEDGDQSRWVSFDLDGSEAEEMAALGVTPDLSEVRTRQEGAIRTEESPDLDPLKLLQHYKLDMENLKSLQWQLLPNWPVNN